MFVTVFIFLPYFSIQENANVFKSSIEVCHIVFIAGDCTSFTSVVYSINEKKSNGWVIATNYAKVKTAGRYRAAYLQFVFLFQCNDILPTLTLFCIQFCFYRVPLNNITRGVFSGQSNCRAITAIVFFNGPIKIDVIGDGKKTKIAYWAPRRAPSRPAFCRDEDVNSHTEATLFISLR